MNIPNSRWMTATVLITVNLFAIPPLLSLPMIKALAVVTLPRMVMGQATHLESILSTQTTLALHHPSLHNPLHIIIVQPTPSPASLVRYDILMTKVVMTGFLAVYQTSILLDRSNRLLLRVMRVRLYCRGGLTWTITRSIQSIESLLWPTTLAVGRQAMLRTYLGLSVSLCYQSSSRVTRVSLLALQAYPLFDPLHLPKSSMRLRTVLFRYLVWGAALGHQPLTPETPRSPRFRQ